MKWLAQLDAWGHTFDARWEVWFTDRLQSAFDEAADWLPFLWVCFMGWLLARFITG